MSLRRQLNDKLGDSKSSNISEDSFNNISDDTLELKYIIKNKELSIDDLNTLLYMISNSKFEGSNINQVFELILKLQYKLKLLEEKING